VNQEALAAREEINKVASERAAAAKAKRAEEILEEEAKKEAEKAKQRAEQAKREADNREKARLREAAPSGPRSMQHPPPPPPAGNNQQPGRGPVEGAEDPKKASVPNNTLTSSRYADPNYQQRQRTPPQAGDNRRQPPPPPAGNTQQHGARGGPGRGPSEGADDPGRSSMPNNTLTSSRYANPDYQQRQRTHPQVGNTQQQRPPPPAANTQQHGARGPSGGAADPRRATLPVPAATGPRDPNYGRPGARPYHGFIQADYPNPGTAGPPADAPTGPANNQQQRGGGGRGGGGRDGGRGGRGRGRCGGSGGWYRDNVPG
jgi:translation initiation factor IF-2